MSAPIAQLQARDAVWGKPCDDLFPGIFGRGRDAQLEDEVARLRDEAGLPGFLVCGADAFEDAGAVADLDNIEKTATGAFGHKKKYLSLREFARKAAGSLDDGREDALCTLLFIGLQRLSELEWWRRNVHGATVAQDTGKARAAK